MNVDDDGMTETKEEGRKTGGKKRQLRDVQLYVTAKLSYTRPMRTLHFVVACRLGHASSACFFIYQ